MDFLNVPKLIEQAIYDIMMWILFFPLTLARIVINPREMLRYVKEQDDDGVEESDAFSDAMRPPIFLVIAIIISTGLSVREDISTQASGSMAKLMFASWTSSMASMMIIYSVVPLVGAVFLQMTNKQKLTRKNLSTPFDQQCYIGGPSILAMTALWGIHQAMDLKFSVMLAVALTVWTIVCEYLFFRDNTSAKPSACLRLALATLVVGLAIIVAIFTALFGYKSLQEAWTFRIY